MRDKEYTPKEFKNIVNGQLGDIKMNRQMMNEVKEKCYNKRARVSFLYNWRGYKLVAGVLGAVCIFTGTGYAITHVDGFSTFMSSIGLEKVAEFIQPINRSVSKSNVRLVVEEAVTDNHNTLLVFSLISEGDAVWDEHTSIGALEINPRGSGVSGAPLVSEDGKKLTYYIDRSTRENIYEDNRLSLKVRNINEEKQYEKLVDVQLGGIMAQKEIVSLDREDEIAMNELTDKLGQELKRVNKTTNQPILDEESKLKFE